MIFNRIASAPRVERSSSGVPAPGWIGSLGGMQTASGVTVSQATSMGVSAVYACVRRRSIDAARCPGSLYRMTDGVREPANHYSADLFIAPNRLQTWLEFAEQLYVSYILRGNAYAVALRGRGGRVTELIPINPDLVQVLEAADGELFYNVSPCGLWQMAMLRDHPVCIPQEDVFHVRGLSFNSLVGVSTISLARDAIGLAIGQEQQAGHWMEAGARPGGVLTVDKALSPDAAKRLRDSWNAMKAGIQNVGSTAVLEDGVKWQEMQLTAPELDFWTGRNFQLPEICRFFGVPPSKIFVQGHGANQNLGEQNQNYVNETVGPDLERFEQKWEQFFGLNDLGIQANFDEAQLLRADELTRVTIARTRYLSGQSTANEERILEGRKPLPGGDILIVPANSAALGSDMTGKAPDQAGRPKNGNIPEPSTPTNGDQPGAQKLDPVPLGDALDKADPANRSADNDNDPVPVERIA